MNDPSENETRHDDAALVALVREAGDVLVTPQSTHVEQVRIEVFSRLATTRRRQWRMTRRSALATGSLAATAVLAVVVWLSLPSVGFTELAQAVREKPWIHLKLASSLAPNASADTWFSFSRDVAAMRDGERAFFYDLRLGVQYEYDPQEKKLFRLPLSDQEEFRLAAALFAAIFGGREFSGDDLFHLRIVDRSRREISEHNRTWIEYEFLLRRASATIVNNSPLLKMVLRADPQSHLPATMRIQTLDDQAELQGQPKTELDYVFDYPDEGPVDIYALGVPRSAELVDRVPRDDVSRVVKANNSSLNDFDSYFAIVTNETPFIANESPTYTKGQKVQHVTIEHLVWRKGKKVRVENCIKRQAGKRSDPPVPGEDMLAWWKKQLPLYERIPTLISDGKKIYHVDIDKYNKDGKLAWNVAKRIRSQEPLKQTHLSLVRGNFAEFHAFHRFGVSSRGGIALDANPQQGPLDTVLVKVSNASYWLDPMRSFGARRIEFSFGDAKPYVYELDNFQPTPSGIWIPTRVRWKNSVDLYEDGTFRGDQVKRFYHDFKAELPDDLFRPTNKIPELTP